MGKKRGPMTKRPSTLVSLPGCGGCGKLCRYNGPVADPVTASYFDWEDAYGCNSRLQGFELKEGD